MPSAFAVVERSWLAFCDAEFVLLEITGADALLPTFISHAESVFVTFSNRRLLGSRESILDMPLVLITLV